MKVPFRYAVAALNATNRGYDRPYHITERNLANVTHQYMVRVTNLRPYFASNRDYQDFRQQIAVPHRHWRLAIIDDIANRKYARRQIQTNPDAPDPGGRRSRSRSGSRSRSRSRSASPPRPPPRVRNTPRYKKGELAMTTKLGPEFTLQEFGRAERSLMSIDPAQDECDPTDVNLPKPACRAINKVCKGYNRARQYVPFAPDGSEHRDYQVRVRYR